MAKYGYKMKSPLSGAFTRQPLRAVHLRNLALILIYKHIRRSQGVFLNILRIYGWSKCLNLNENYGVHYEVHNSSSQLRRGWNFLLGI